MFRYLKQQDVRLEIGNCKGLCVDNRKLARGWCGNRRLNFGTEIL